jgi:hypothetical protein
MQWNWMDGMELELDLDGMDNYCVWDKFLEDGIGIELETL